MVFFNRKISLGQCLGAFWGHTGSDNPKEHKAQPKMDRWGASREQGVTFCRFYSFVFCSENSKVVVQRGQLEGVPLDASEKIYSSMLRSVDEEAELGQLDDAPSQANTQGQSQIIAYADEDFDPPAPKRRQGQRARPKQQAKRDWVSSLCPSLHDAEAGQDGQGEALGQQEEMLPLADAPPSRSRPSQQCFNQTTRPTQSGRTTRRSGPTAGQVQRSVHHFRGHQGQSQQAYIHTSPYHLSCPAQLPPIVPTSPPTTETILHHSSIAPLPILSHPQPCLQQASTSLLRQALVKPLSH